MKKFQLYFIICSPPPSFSSQYSFSASTYKQALKCFFLYKRPDTWTSSLLDTSSRLPPYIPVPGREASATFNTGSCTNNQQGLAWSRIYLEIGILIEVANLERGHGMIKTQSVGISNRHRFAVMVYLSPLVHPEAVDVGVQDHLQGVQGRLQGPGR